MTDLVRRALLGDNQAQEECTKNMIVLSCPFCKGNLKQLITDHTFKCDKCGCLFNFPVRMDMSMRDYIAMVNTRVAPPIGMCKDCKYSSTGKYDSYLVCCVHGSTVDKEDWCNDFEQKEEEYD